LRRVSTQLSNRRRLSESDLEAAIEAMDARCRLSATEITAWTQKLKLPGAENERHLQRLITYWYTQAASLLSVPSASEQARVRDYVKRQLALGNPPEKIALPSHFDRVDQWLPEIAEQLTAIRSELLALPGDVAAALRKRFRDYETAIDSLSTLSQVLNEVAGSWHRPHPGQPSRETESWAIDLLVCAVEDFTEEKFPPPRSYKRLDEIALVRLLADQLFPEAGRAAIDTMLRHFHNRRLKKPRARRPARQKRDM
jgi:hypothetical protein